MQDGVKQSEAHLACHVLFISMSIGVYEKTYDYINFILAMLRETPHETSISTSSE
jgi:hypothetical protein